MVDVDEIVQATVRELGRTLWGPDPGARTRAPRWWPSIMTPISFLALLGFTAIGARYLLDARGLSATWAWIIAVFTVAPMAFVWHRPLWAWRIATVGFLIGGIGMRPEEAAPWAPLQLVVALIVVFMVALAEPFGVVLWTAAITVGITLAGSKPENVAGSLVILVVVMLLGEQIQRRRRAQLRLHEEEERSELAEARRALLEERARIARELHDVVAHSMSLLAVRAETAPFRLPDLPEPARKEFTALAATARETLGELRRLLGVLRTAAEPERAPQPSLADLPELIESARAAGMRIDALVLIGPVPPATGLAAYRIVQEALSNAARHAPGAPVRVDVTLAEDLNLLVRNEPGTEPGTEPGPAAPSSSGAGHGLAGMHERAAVLGGTLRAEPTPDGGFVVDATLPVALEAE